MILINELEEAILGEAVEPGEGSALGGIVQDCFTVHRAQLTMQDAWVIDTPGKLPKLDASTFINICLRKKLPGVGE